MTEISDAVSFASGIFAAVLLVISLFAYKNTKARRLIFVSAAFGLFSLREIVARLDTYIQESQSATIETALAVAGFAILGLFFIAIVLKPK
jgi:uncharacterized membrane protein YhfC